MKELGVPQKYVASWPAEYIHCKKTLRHHRASWYLNRYNRILLSYLCGMRLVWPPTISHWTLALATPSSSKLWIRKSNSGIQTIHDKPTNRILETGTVRFYPRLEACLISEVGFVCLYSAVLRIKSTQLLLLFWDVSYTEAPILEYDGCWLLRFLYKVHKINA